MKEWKKLDNAAKIFPSAAEKADTQVFRFSCELKDAVRPDILQIAVNDALDIFKVYQCILKRGFFWYYLESCDITPVVREEQLHICSRIYVKNKRKLLFRVSYFGTRINLEFFHALCDGTGALHFLRMILVKYLSRRYNIDEPELDYDASYTQMSDDSFDKYYTEEKVHKHPGIHKVCLLTGARLSENRLRAISGCMKASAVIEAAHKYNASVTAFLSACLMTAISETVSVRATKLPIVLSLPVNLRKRFESESARNFFGIIFTSYNFSSNSHELGDIAAKVSADLKSGLTNERLTDVINGYTSIEHNIFARIVPLLLKDIVLKLAYRYSNLKNTAVLSNVGKIEMPDELQNYIKSFYIYASTNRLQSCICSFGDMLTVNFTSAFISTEVQRRFFRLLTELGIQVDILTNINDTQGERL